MRPAASARLSWAGLLDPDEGPLSAHETSLVEVEQHLAARLLRDPLLYLAGIDEHLAAVAALDGPAPCRGFCATIEELFAQAVRAVGREPVASGHARAAFQLLSLASIAESCGARALSQSFDAAPCFDDLPLGKLGEMDKATLSLLALGAGRREEPHLLLGEPSAPFAPDHVCGADRRAFALHLTGAVEAGADASDVSRAWEAFLRGFPAGLRTGELEWRYLLAAARVVYSALGGTPVSEVASVLHLEIEALAAESMS